MFLGKLRSTKRLTSIKQLSHTWARSHYVLQKLKTKVEQCSRNAVDIAGISEPFEPRHDKTNKMSVRPAKTDQIRPVWSESSLCTEWVAKDPSFLHADSEDSDQTGRMPRLIWVFARRTVTLFVLSCRGSFDYPPCLNYKVSFSARKAIRIHLPSDKNFSAIPDDIRIWPEYTRIESRNAGDFANTSLQVIMWIICA